MIRTTVLAAALACLSAGYGASALADDTAASAAAPIAAPAPPPPVPATPAQACLDDVHAFTGQLHKDGYWLGGSDGAYGYGSEGYGMVSSASGEPMSGYRSARPGYEIRILMASATILARHGQFQACEEGLATARAVYKDDASDLKDRGRHGPEGPGWEQQQINAALSVTGRDASFRSDQILDADVRSPKDEALGSVHDLVLSPKTGKIAYLIVARGGVFGFDQTYIPVPWKDFKATRNLGLLVLDTNKAAMDAAPTVLNDTFAAPGQFDQQSQKVDGYWKAHLMNKIGG